MADTRILEQETFIDDSTVDAEQARMAADDLRHIEEEVKQEAEASVEDYDDEGSETCSVEDSRHGVRSRRGRASHRWDR